jgi:hypothetical protein
MEEDGKQQPDLTEQVSDKITRHYSYSDVWSQFTSMPLAYRLFVIVFIIVSFCIAIKVQNMLGINTSA